jgi:hypothetical protein
MNQDPHANSPGSSLPVTIASLDELRAWGWDAERLVEAIGKLRQETIAGLPAQAVVDPSTFAPVYWEHPKSWRLLVRQDQTILGCWHFMSLTRDVYAAAMEGKLNAIDIRNSMLRSLGEPGMHDLYVLTYVVRPEWRLSAATLQLARSMFDVFLELAQQGIFIENLGANFVTDEGRAIGRALSLDFRCDHAVFGTVYHANFPVLLNRLAFDDRRNLFVQQLRDLYPASKE